MAEHHNDRDRLAPFARKTLMARLLANKWVLFAAFSATMFLIADERLAVHDALFLGGAIVAAVLILPRRAAMARRRAESVNLEEAGIEEAFARFADAMAMPIIIIDARAIVQHVSTLARKSFPKLEGGMPVSFSLRHPDLLAAIEACRQTKSMQTIELRLPIPNETWFQVSLAPVSTYDLPGAGPAAERIILTLMDTTERRRIDTMRADFVANASHELRTPLTSLIGFIETLQGSAANDAEARTKFLGIMRAQAARMSHLINDLLSLSRIELHQHVQPTTPIDLSVLLREIVEGIQPLADEAKLALRLDISQENAQIVGDRNELYEVFENLIDNAIKYGSNGAHVDISLAAAHTNQGASYVVRIADHGPGISSEHVPRLTERFYRVDAETSRQKKGTGLGLAIVKHIVSRHKGLMAIRSELGAGTTVEISLPGIPLD